MTIITKTIGCPSLYGFAEGGEIGTGLPFLTRSTSLRAGLRRKEESFQPSLRHDYAVSHRIARLKQIALCMNGTTELGVYETFEGVFGRKSTPEELIVDIGSCTQKSVLWVCAVIVTGMQLWTRIELAAFGCISATAYPVF